MVHPPAIKRYPDLRYKFIRGLKKHEYQQRQHVFLKGAAEWTSKAIVSLSLADQPIRSAKQAIALEGVGPTIKARLDKIQKGSDFSSDPPPPGVFISTAAGLLVGLLNATEEAPTRNEGSSAKPLIGEPELHQACQAVCQEKFSTATVSTDGNPVLCPAWWRINVLISRGLVKKRTRGKQPVYELLPEGEEIARRLRGPNHIVSRAAGPSGYERSVRPTSTATSGKTPVARKPSSGGKIPVRPVHKAPEGSPEDDALYSYDDGSDGVILLVDHHEMGGERHRLGELSRMLKEWNVRHKTTGLPCGDYLWLWRCNGSVVTLPVLVERKRADDVAYSLKDGRFDKQRERMLEWREKFGVLSSDVSLKYVIESEPEAYRVRCADGCGGVGRCGNPTVEQVQVALSELESSAEFGLVKTPNLQVTVEFLVSVTTELQQRVRNGDFEAHRMLRQIKRPTSLGPTATRTRTEPQPPRDTLVTQKKSLPCPPGTSGPSSSYIEIEDSQESVVSGICQDDFSMNPSQTSTRKTVKASGLGTSGRKRYRAIDIDDVSDEEDHGKRIILSPSSGGISKIFYSDSDSDEESLLGTSVFGGECADFSKRILSSPASHNGSSGISSYTGGNESADTNLSTKRTNSLVKPPSSSRSQESDQSKTSEIQSILPDVSFAYIVSALSSSNGDVERALAFILDSGMAESNGAQVKEDLTAVARYDNHDTVDLTLSQ